MPNNNITTNEAQAFLNKNYITNYIDIDRIGTELHGKRNGKRGWYLCDCPVCRHHDCLSVDYGANGEIVFRCFSQKCDFEAIIAALRDRGLWPERGAGGGKTTAERAAESIAARRKKDEEQARSYAQAADKAKDLLEAAGHEDPQAHPYNLKRGGRWTGQTARRGHWPFHGKDNDALLLPAYDAAGKIWSLQAIASAGDFSIGSRKDFYPGGKMGGNFYPFAPLGPHTRRTFIGEGFFTLQAAQEGFYQGGPEPPEPMPEAWVVAFTAGNLTKVAAAIHAAYPQAEIIILADEDGAGIKEANAAATATGGTVARPSAGLPDGATVREHYDFDDLLNEAGGQAVKLALRLARKPEPEPECVKDAGEQACHEQQQAGATASEEEERLEAEALKMLAEVPQFDILKALTEEPPPRSYVLKGYIPTGVVVSLAAQGGTGKSYLSNVIAAALGAGRDILPFEVESPRTVLMINAEDQARDIAPRFYHIANQYGFSHGEIQNIARNVVVKPMFGIIRGLMTPGHHGTEPRKTASALVLEKLIEQHNPALVVLDTKSRLYGLKENVAEDGAAWLQYLESILKNRPEMAFLVLTHTGKKNAATMKTQDAERGTSANVDNARGGLVYHRAMKDGKTREPLTTPDGAKVFCLTHVKCNYKDERPDVFFIRGLGGVPVMIDDPQKNTEAAQRLKLAESLGELVKILANFPAGLRLAPLEEGRGEEAKEIRAQIKRETGLDGKRIGELIAYGIEQGKLIKEKDATAKGNNKPVVIRLANPPKENQMVAQGELF